MPSPHDLFNQLNETVKKAYEKKYKTSETKFIKASEEKPPTGLILDNPLLEHVLDRRYLSYGRFYLVYGKKSSSKTSLFYDIAKMFQKNGGKVIWLETENAIDLEYAKKQGVNLDEVTLIHPQTLEEALNVAELYIRSLGKIDPEGQMPILICLDSIAGSTTDYEQDSTNNMTNTMPGTHARLLARFYREMEHPLANERCVFLALNQLKTKIGGFVPFGGEAESMMGGEAPRFSSTYQIKMERTGDLKKTNEHGAERKIGSKHDITCTRNKLGREGNTQKVSFDLYINGGIDWYTPLVRLIGEHYPDLINKAGSYYRWKVDGMTYKGLEDEDIPLSTEEQYRDFELGAIIRRCEAAKEAIRTVLEVPAMPSEEDLKASENERLAKRKKKRETEKEPKEL